MTCAFRNDLILVDGFPKSVKTFATQYEYPITIDMPKSVTCSNQTHIFQWYVVICGSENILPKNTWFIRYRSTCSDIAHHHDLAKKLT
jgi:hypothetical protein